MSAGADLIVRLMLMLAAQAAVVGLIMAACNLWVTVRQTVRGWWR